jgi:hypothetical protein
VKRSALAAASIVLASLALGADTSLPSIEKRFEEVRALDDESRLREARGADTESKRESARDAKREALRLSLLRDLEALPAPSSADDRRAVAAMKAALAAEGADDAKPTELAKLTDSVYAAYTKAAERIPFDGEILNRLSVFERVARTEDASERRRLFLSLAPLWKSVNGENDENSPYRRIVRGRRAEWRALPEAKRPYETKPKELGLDRKRLEEWLVALLERWRAMTPERELEPWDYAYTWGAADRVLAPRIPRRSLRKGNDAYFGALGAAPGKLGIEYDLEPRSGKDPVSYTDFGRRARRENDRWIGGESWVFASYRTGGLGILAELLHETGHGIHISAIRTRPAFLDWPDSDVFTEALADFPALEVYEPAWQRRYLGAEAELADSLRSKYSGIVMDVAWAYFEMQVHDADDADPNAIWTEITHRYLRIKPHPELSWWAMRGQLIGSPAYLMNYALGSFLAADLRARTRELRGKPFVEDDRSLYPFLCERLYRFGLERPSLTVIEDYLGRPLAPRALLDDMQRAARSAEVRDRVEDEVGLEAQGPDEIFPEDSRSHEDDAAAGGARSPALVLDAVADDHDALPR